MSRRYLYGATMVKKIPVDKLRPGMFIKDFCCGWLEHPFFSRQLTVRDGKTIRKIIDHGIREVYIDTSKGLDVAEAPSEAEVHQELQAEMTRVLDTGSVDLNTVPLARELGRATEVRREAATLVKNMMGDIRLGKQIEMEKVNPMVERMVGSILRNKDALLSLVRIKQAHEYTYLHCLAVCALMLAFSRSLELEREDIHQIGVGALLHDIGKMRVPAEILNKQGPLTEDEFERVKEHVEYGCAILSEAQSIPPAAMLVAAEHHERKDGSGYPRGLRGGQISRFGRMAAIVDIYDALTSDRCYRKGIAPTEAVRKLYELGRHHLDEELVHRFIRCVGIYPIGTLVRLEGGMLGVVVEPGAGSLVQPVVRLIYDTRSTRFVAPRDVDLSRQPEGGWAEHIVCPEPPERWNIDPEAFVERYGTSLEESLLSPSEGPSPPSVSWP